MRTKADPRRFMDPALRRDVRFLTSLLGEIIREQEGLAFFRAVERIRVLAKAGRAGRGRQIRKLRRLIGRLPVSRAMKVARAFTIYFQLVNLAEEAQRIRRLHWYQSRGGAELEMSLLYTAHRLKSAGVSPARLAAALRGAEVTPVLTAHPTEVRRRTTLDHLADVGRALEVWNSAAAPAQRLGAERSIRQTLEILWNTNEARRRTLTVQDEVSQSLFFIERTILGLVPDLYESLEEMVRTAAPRARFRVPSFLTFGSWVGADRDGNPHVTPEVTWETARAHRSMILGFYRSRLEDLIRRFSQAQTLTPVSRALELSLERDQRRLPEPARLLARYEASEHYRKKLSFIHTRILRAEEGAEAGYRSARELIGDLALIQSSLRSHGSRHAAAEMDRLIRQVETFGFYLARLEFREHRDRLLQAAGELLPRILRSRVSYPALSEEERVRLLHPIVSMTRPPRFSEKGISPAARDLLAQFRTMGRIQSELDPELARTYLLSMTRAPSDLLAVLALGAAAGVRFDAVPLFETITDLGRSDQVMCSLWADPVYRRTLAARDSRQEVMLGYSDANKDGGYLAANWALYQAQAGLSRSARRFGVKLVLFHGKGGTIDRGGGLSHRAIVAQPFAAPGCRIKITEQGEVVAAKYSQPAIARRNIEQLVSAVLLANLVEDRGGADGRRFRRWEAMMEELARHSERAYRALVFDDPDFVRYTACATPIQILLEVPVAGTRPGKRPSSARAPGWTVRELRAIPWVFSWVQSRHMLSAWYGIGSAIEAFRRRHGAAGLRELAQMSRSWPFARVLWENAQASLAKTDLEIARCYAALAEPSPARQRIFRDIRAEYARASRGILEVTGERALLENQPILRHSILLRNPYVDPLNMLQLRGLQLLRRRSARERWLELVRLTVHGIAYGMKSTG